MRGYGDRRNWLRFLSLGSEQQDGAVMVRPPVLAVLFFVMTTGVSWGAHDGTRSFVEVLGKPPPLRDRTFVVAQFNPCPGGECPGRSITVSVFRELKGKSQMEVEPFGVTLKELRALNVYDSEGELIDQVAKTLELTDDSGKVVAITIEVPTGILIKLLGGGDSEVIVKLDQLQYNGSRLATKLTKEELSRLPKWSD